jgi:hypothetical protein
MKDKIRYCPIPYAITEVTINSVILISEADDCVPRRSEILSSAVSTTNTAITMIAVMKIALLPTFGDDDRIFMMKTPASQPRHSSMKAHYNVIDGIISIIVFGPLFCCCEVGI